MSDNIKEIVREKYAEIVTQGTSCCSGTGCCENGVETVFSESYQTLEGYNPDADFGLGCGLPTEYARIQPGYTVLDLGAGAGNDVFIARQLTGAAGRVIGLDMTEAMVRKANENKAKLGYDNVEFILGDIEAIPLPDSIVDVAISNCVMNLVPDKQKAYGEVFRVLKEGGHFSISDIVLDGELPENLQKAAELYTGCVAGAMQKDEYLDVIRQAGFVNLTIDKEREYSLPEGLLAQYLSPSQIEAFRNSGSRILSLNVFAEKP